MEVTWFPEEKHSIAYFSDCSFSAVKEVFVIFKLNASLNADWWRAEQKVSANIHWCLQRHALSPFDLTMEKHIGVIKENNKFITFGGKEKLLFMVQVKKQLSRPCFRFGRLFKSMFSFWTFLWLNSEPLGGSSRKLWCTSHRLVFTFKEPKRHGEHIHIQEAYKILKSRI